MTEVAAHVQQTTHTYRIHYPEHSPRTSDPHYRDFDAYHRKTRAAARCYIGQRIGFGDCRDAQGRHVAIDRNGQMSGLELHHSHIEFALQNGISLEALEVDYPGISNPDEVGAWIETAANLRWYCVGHHRASGSGAHSGAHSDFEGSLYIAGLLSSASSPPLPDARS